MKKFFEEFKKFITRGNVIDLAVGVIIGGAFTAIVTALTTNILTPLINYIIYLISGNENSLEGVYLVLVKVLTADGALDTANSIFIDWGAFISAIINFLLISFILFIIVKSINKIQENNAKLKADIKKNALSKEDKKELKKRNISLCDRKAVSEYIKERDDKLKAEEEAKKQAEEEQAKLDRLNNPTELDLLKDIKELLKNNK